MFSLAHMFIVGPSRACISIFFQILVMAEENNSDDQITSSLPPPKFETKPSNRGRIFCQICFTGCLEKHKSRSKFEKITDVNSFKSFAERWRNVEHDYNRVVGLVDWTSGQEKLAHKSCKGTFFKESYLQSQAVITNSVSEETEQSKSETPSIEQSSGSRKSSRKSLQYKSSQV